MHKIMFASLLLTACPDGGGITTYFDTNFDTLVTTFSTMSSPNITGEAPTSEGTSEVTTGETAAETTGDMTDESSLSETSAPGDTSSESSTTGEQVEPMPIPPTGCAVFIEALPRTMFANERYVVVDMTRCPRDKLATLTYQTATPAPSSWEALIARRNCGVFGGNESPASEPGPGEDGVVMSMVGTDDATAVLLRLEIDGEVSDELILPDDLAGQTWLGEPNAPVVPVRRRADWAWIPIEDHKPGCDLSVDF